jgi:hypothetical protein
MHVKLLAVKIFCIIGREAWFRDEFWGEEMIFHIFECRLFVHEIHPITAHHMIETPTQQTKRQSYLK